MACLLECQTCVKCEHKKKKIYSLFVPIENSTNTQARKHTHGYSYWILGLKKKKKKKKKP